MSVAPVVSNSSPLIALDGIGRLDLLGKLFGTVHVPPAVARETAGPRPLPSWIHEAPLAQPIGPRILSASLGLGESEALSMAMELGAAWLLLDDRPARRLAQALGLPVVGTLGVLLACKRRGLIPAVRPELEALAKFGFRMSPALYDLILVNAGESSE